MKRGTDAGELRRNGKKPPPPLRAKTAPSKIRRERWTKDLPNGRRSAAEDVHFGGGRERLPNDRISFRRDSRGEDGDKSRAATPTRIPKIGGLPTEPSPSGGNPRSTWNRERSGVLVGVPSERLPESASQSRSGTIPLRPNRPFGQESERIPAGRKSGRARQRAVFRNSFRKTADFSRRT